MKNEMRKMMKRKAKACAMHRGFPAVLPGGDAQYFDRYCALPTFHKRTDYPGRVILFFQQNNNLDPAILSSAFPRFIIGGGQVKAIALYRNAAFIHAFLYQVLLHRPGAFD